MNNHKDFGASRRSADAQQPYQFFRIAFIGRKIGAIGITYPIVAARTARTPEEAILDLYDQYEHITKAVATPHKTGTPWNMPATAQEGR